VIGSPRSLPRRAFAAALLLLASSCGILDPDPVRVRVRNSTGHNLEAIRVTAPRTSERFGSLEAGKTSRYHAANRAYIFPYIEALLDGTVVRQQPRDFVGEEPMEPGTYTYELRLSSKQPYFLHATVIRE
jgi:hypothetical protein